MELLHSLRFLGNEAVHELITPEENDINVAFNIIEHLIQSIYIMPKDLKKTKFKIHLDEYQKFENFIIESIKTSPSFDFSYSYSIKKLIGARGKISNENQSKFETILKEKISKDELDWIEITENTEVENINPSETFYRIKKVP
ncbi:MAG: DUF4145 domain-containing protein [Acinetobacter populi]|uniref:hypothetical protein n=1 Tax=Acinetobacter populi TaxID=1582270 RepID=UPI00235489E5|nr:hypothetical protein [Acinetobacter populi]MCH4247568.1 DUF4145 domain-containing protein [Acinetobacter populi]